jgi:carotene epsilon-monooxygenase
VLGDRLQPTSADYRELAYVMRCINESMRLYPHPPVLLRRAREKDTLPGGYEVGRGRVMPSEASRMCILWLNPCMCVC